MRDANKIMIFSNSGVLNTKSRSQSAKGISSLSRPQSGVTKSKYQKTEQDSHLGKESKSIIFSNNVQKSLIFKGVTGEQFEKFKRTQPLKTTKDREQLFEQNMHLKKQINKLTEEMVILRVKLGAQAKISTEHSKRLDREFEKPFYWEGNKSHLISGIKHQYEKLKKQYSQKSRQYDELKIELLQSKAPEYRIYAESVMTQNQRLRSKLQTLQLSNNSVVFNAEANPEVREERRKIEQQLEIANQSLLQKNKKIMFLEKLIINKDNKQFHAGSKLRRIEKKNEQLSAQNEKLKEKNQQIYRQYKGKIEALHLQHNRKYEKIQEDLQQQIEEKNKIIQALQQDLKFYESGTNKLKISSGNPSMRNYSQNMASNGSHFRKYSNTIHEEEDLTQSVRVNFSSTLTHNYENIQQQSKEPQIAKVRVPQTADKKHSENSKKMRKVNFSEVQQIGQLLRYRLYSQGIDSKSIKNFFNKKDESFINIDENGQDEKQSEWEEEFITMRETVGILTSFPFLLEQPLAELLARYLIEDCQEEFVYCDEGNQNKREVVKSIMKSIVGDYDAPNEKVVNQFEQFMRQYGANLQSALTCYYPSGIVGAKKLHEVLHSLGAEPSEQLETYLIGKIAVASTNLSNLEYKQLFLKAQTNGT